MLPPTFPAETVPDNTVFTVHHFIYPLVLAFVPLFREWDDYRDREPWITMVGILVALMSFVLAWPNYPELGAAGSAVGLLLGFVGLLRPAWGEYWGNLSRVLLFLLLAAATDDWLSHALGWWTPLDHIWKIYVVSVVA